jgi:hypothetical protein
MRSLSIVPTPPVVADRRSTDLLWSVLSEAAGWPQAIRNTGGV